MQSCQIRLSTQVPSPYDCSCSWVKLTVLKVNYRGLITGVIELELDKTLITLRMFRWFYTQILAFKCHFFSEQLCVCDSKA